MELHDGDIITFKDNINELSDKYSLRFKLSNDTHDYYGIGPYSHNLVYYNSSALSDGNLSNAYDYSNNTWNPALYYTNIIKIYGDQTITDEAFINWLYENVESGLPDPPGPEPGPDSEYKITEISFSLFTDMESGSRVTTLKAHISYEFLGFNNTKEYGTAVAEIADVCSVTFDADGKAQTITTESMPDRDTILSAVTDAVEADIKDVTIRAQEDSFKRSYLGKISKGYDDNGTLVPWESRFTPQPPPTYPELDNMNTGIGAVGYNEIFNN